LVPFFFGGSIDGIVKAFEQGAGKCGARFGSKGEGLFQKFRNFLSPEAILLPGEWLRPTTISSH
jgi:hypothetical protein